MIKSITSSKSIDFIKLHIKSKVSDIALLATKYPDLPIKEICNQIECRQKAKLKVASWVSNFYIIFPPKISWEQCSSEQTAKYKASILKGNSLIDLTGGFGIDSYFLSKSFKQVTHIEQSVELQSIAEYNFNALKAKNIESIQADSIEYLKKLNKKFDCIYIDPARRDKNNNKVNSLTDSTPNVIENLNLLRQKSDSILIKTSPLLDIKHTIKELKTVHQVHVVSLKNECKEVLYLLGKKGNENPIIICVNLDSDHSVFEFDYSYENSQKAEFSEPQKYLYEPNSSTLKAGAFKSIAQKYELKKLNINSHLYTSNFNLKFCGKRFKVIATCALNKKEVLNYIPSKKANIATRNFKYKPDVIAKKLGLKQGGDLMLFATTLANNKMAIIITKPIP